MKTLIVFQSKYGCTEKCANLIKDELVGEVSILEVKAVKYDDILSAEKIVIGGPIYIGRIRKGIKKFCNKNLEILKKKKIGLFICCLKEDKEAMQELETAYPIDLVKNAMIKECFGGEITYQKLKFLERKIMDMVAKSDQASFPQMDENKNISTLDYEKIKHFADTINMIK